MSARIADSTLTKWRMLVHKVVSLTEKGKLRWGETSDENTYIVVYEGLAIVLRYSPEDGEHGQPLYEFQIRDREGNTLDRFDDEILDQGGSNEYYRTLADLFMGMSRRTSGAEAVLDKLLSKMEADDSDDIPF